MSDVICACCGEPWDAYEVFHGFAEDERELFLAGSGCPTCFGKPSPQSDHRQEWAETLLEATDDPDAVLDNIMNRLEKDK